MAVEDRTAFPGALMIGSDAGVMPGATHLALAADTASVREALIRIGAALQGAGIASADVETAELVLAEALNNVVEHAFADMPEHGWIELTVVPGAAGIGCELRDNGRPMPNGQLPCPALPGAQALPCADALDSLPEGGFGWFLIRSLACDLRYAREIDTNRLVMRIPYGAR